MTTSLCKVCLKGNARMLSIGDRDKQLIEVYKKLTRSGETHNTEGGQLLRMCYMCVSDLQRCCRISDLARNAPHLPHNGNQLTQMGVTHQLTVTAIAHVINRNRM